MSQLTKRQPIPYAQRKKRKPQPPGYRLALAPMGPGDRAARKHGYGFRGAVEDALVAVTGSISISAASRIHTAAVALRRHLQAEKRLAALPKDASAEQWALLADRAIRYKQVVDTCLTSLGLDARSIMDPQTRAVQAVRAILADQANADEEMAPGVAQATPAGPPANDGGQS
jgi:hypothetical protein